MSSLCFGLAHKVHRVQSSVWRLPNYWPPTPSPPSECVLPPHQRRGEGVHTRRAVRGGWSIFRKTPDIGLASNSIIPLRIGPLDKKHRKKTERAVNSHIIGQTFSPLLTRLWALFTAFLNKEKPISSPPLKGSTFTSYLHCMHISLWDAAEMYYVHCTILQRPRSQLTTRLRHSHIAMRTLTFNIWS